MRSTKCHSSTRTWYRSTVSKTKSIWVTGQKNKAYPLLLEKHQLLLVLEQKQLLLLLKQKQPLPVESVALRKRESKEQEHQTKYIPKYNGG